MTHVCFDTDITNTHLAIAPSLQLHSMACTSVRASVSVRRDQGVPSIAHYAAQCATFPLNVRLSPLPIHKKPGLHEQTSSVLSDEVATGPSGHP